MEYKVWPHMGSTFGSRPWIITGNAVNWAGPMNNETKTTKQVEVVFSFGSHLSCPIAQTSKDEAARNTDPV